MPRLPRPCPVGIPQHIIQRGNNRQVCFNNDDDIAAYAHWLIDYSRKFQIEIHAWVFMTNHVHLLATPNAEHGVSKMMQSLGRHYVRYFNQTYRRSGTLWEGRFKSCLIQSENYLLECYRYIELNPVRAGMVDDPADYIWSSYHSNAFGKQSKLITPHAEYLALSRTELERLNSYRELFQHHISGDRLKEIQDSLEKGLIYGSDVFKDQIEFNLNRKVRLQKSGRKPKQKFSWTPIQALYLKAVNLIRAHSSGLLLNKY